MPNDSPWKLFTICPCLMRGMAEALSQWRTTRWWSFPRHFSSKALGFSICSHNKQTLYSFFFCFFETEADVIFFWSSRKSTSKMPWISHKTVAMTFSLDRMPLLVAIALIVLCLQDCTGKAMFHLLLQLFQEMLQDLDANCLNFSMKALVCS